MKSLRNIAERELDRGIRKLAQAGIGIDEWLAMLGAGEEAMRRFVAGWPGFVPGILYDAQAMAEILGIPIKANGPCPAVLPRRIIVYYDGWHLPQLRLCKAVLERMWQDQSWYDDRGWKAEPGYWEVILPVPKSNRKNADRQDAFLRQAFPGFDPAPIPVACSALLVHLQKTGEDPLNGNWVRCAERTRSGNRVGLRVVGGRVSVDGDWVDDADDDVFSAAARRLSS